MEKILHISAGGNGKRIAAQTAVFGPDFPKHLLPLPLESKTLIGEIVHKALNHFDKIVVWAAEYNISLLRRHIVQTGVEIVLDDRMSGPLGPIACSLQEKQTRVYGCAGDFYCDFSWKDFEDFHDSHDLPISILVARSVEVPRGARFSLKGNVVDSWERVKFTTLEDHINIGCYILDAASDVVKEINSLEQHKEDVFFDKFVPLKLIAGYDPKVKGYNVNVEYVYRALINMLS